MRQNELNRQVARATAKVCRRFVDWGFCWRSRARRSAIQIQNHSVGASSIGMRSSTIAPCVWDGLAEMPTCQRMCSIILFNHNNHFIVVRGFGDSGQAIAGAVGIRTGSADASNGDESAITLLPSILERTNCMRIYFINHLGGGFADHLEVAGGMTVGQLFEEKVGGDPASYLIRVNRYRLRAIKFSMSRTGHRDSHPHRRGGWITVRFL